MSKLFLFMGLGAAYPVKLEASREVRNRRFCYMRPTSLEVTNSQVPL